MVQVRVFRFPRFSLVKIHKTKIRILIKMPMFGQYQNIGQTLRFLSETKIASFGQQSLFFENSRNFPTISTAFLLFLTNFLHHFFFRISKFM